jgi:hypothetical protein
MDGVDVVAGEAPCGGRAVGQLAKIRYNMNKA